MPTTAGVFFSLTAAAVARGTPVPSIYLYGGQAPNLPDGSPGENNEVWGLIRDANGTWPDSWAQLSPAVGGPGFRYPSGYVAPMAIINSAMYVTGSGPASTGVETWKFDLDLEEWIILETSQGPTERRDATSFVHRGLWYIYGGSWYSDYQDTQDLWRFDPGDETWTELELSGYPIDDLDHGTRAGTVVDGDMLYVVGGCCHAEESKSDVWRLDITTLNFEKLNTTGDAPKPTVEPVVAVDSEQQLWVATNDAMQANNGIWKLNLSSNVWTKTDLDSKGGLGWTGVSLDDKIYTHGGRGTCNDGSNTCHYQTNELDLSSGQWAILPNLAGKTVNPSGVGSSMKAQVFYRDNSGSQGAAAALAPITWITSCTATLAVLSAMLR